MAKAHKKLGYQVGLYLDPQEDDPVLDDRGAACQMAYRNSVGESDTVFCVHEVGPKGHCDLIGVWLNGRRFSEVADA